jgi:hypothetical protein
MKERITSAHVLAIVAIVLALGGNAIAFTLGKSSVGTKQLKREAVTAAKVKKHTLTRKQINVAKLGTVARAKSAQSLGGLSADQIEQSSKLSCPADTELLAGVCFETAERPAEEYVAALETCGKANRSLPSVGQLAAFLVAQDEGKAEWAGSPYVEGTQFRGTFVTGGKGGITTGGTSVFTAVPFRCVTLPSN